jgi:LacI family transcriptional regulator
MGKITLRSIAKHFNVSIATVSKALNNLPDIGMEMKEKIRDYAKKNNYIPNFFGKGLKGVHSKVIGVVLSDTSNPVYTEQLNGIENVLDQAGFSMILCNSKEDFHREKKHLQVLLQKNVDGVLLNPADCKGDKAPEQRYDCLDNFKMPYVLMNRSIKGCKADIVKSDDLYSARKCTQYLIKKGHKRIIHITNTMHTSAVSDRITGFKHAMKAAGLHLDKSSVAYTDMDYHSCMNKIHTLLNEHNKFTALYIFNDIMALNIMKALQEFGKKIPKDIAIISSDNISFSETCSVPLTTMAQSSFSVGQSAAKILVEKIEGTYTTPCKTHFLIPAGIIERNSV